MSNNQIFKYRHFASQRQNITEVEHHQQQLFRRFRVREEHEEGERHTGTKPYSRMPKFHAKAGAGYKSVTYNKIHLAVRKPSYRDKAPPKLFAIWNKNLLYSKKN